MKDFGRWFADFELPQQKNIAPDNLEEKATELVYADVSVFLWLVNERGGCSCFISPPCSNCTEPLDEAEVEEIFDRFPGYFEAIPNDN